MKHLHAYHRDHFLTRLDARVKLLSALALLGLVLTGKGLMFPLIVAGICLGFTMHAGTPGRVLLIRLAQPLFIAAMVLLLKAVSGHDPLFSHSLFGLTIGVYADGIREGLQIATRIAGAVSVVVLMGGTTPFAELMGALAWFRIPRGLIEVSLFAWRYLFLLFDDALIIYHSQKNRLGYAGYRRGLRSFGTLAGALVIKAFDSSQTITTAMVQRGYDGQMPLVSQKPVRVVEVVASLLIFVVMGLLWQSPLP